MQTINSLPVPEQGLGSYITIFKAKQENQKE